eukprot:scaffold3064_cov95-Isochrysis_galbana.AAC.3
MTIDDRAQRERANADASSSSRRRRGAVRCRAARARATRPSPPSRRPPPAGRRPRSSYQQRVASDRSAVTAQLLSGQWSAPALSTARARELASSHAQGGRWRADM